ncbi:MAG: hypothetical protein IIZ23_04265 [Ruminococcus sp.]|nr:hypothetical protein [Ruminococcus sp.]
MSAKKKKPAKKNKQPAKKPFPVKPFIGACIAAVLIAGLVVFLVFKTNEDNKKHLLRSTYWSSISAKNASGDEVDIREVYNVKASTFQGRLEFDKENGFELWLNQGDKDDGTHTGTYDLSDDKLTATFDSGDVVDFPVIKNGGDIVRIDAPYGDYVVSFFPKE